MAKWEYAQLQVWDAVSGKLVELGYQERARQVFLMGAGGEERDLPVEMGWLELYNLLGSEGWEFISSSYHDRSVSHHCNKHERLDHFVTLTTFKRQTE